MRYGKRVWSVLLLVAMLVLALSGCGCEHQWVEATCTEARMCSLCEKVEGEPLGHTAGEWKDGSVDVLACILEKQQLCEVCNATLETQTEKLNSLHDGNIFLFSAKQYIERMNAVFGETTSGTFSVTEFESDSGFACTVKEMSDYMTVISYYGVNGAIANKYADERNLVKVATIFIDQDADDAIEVITAMTMACDPSLTESDAINIGVALTSDSNEYGVVKNNGLRYRLFSVENMISFDIEVD